ncbi:MAG TPA: RseA family anti-sigma factor [Rhodocyclaceae bacterium]|nr:RseA family anti-sigma factor [Rhodocyclaceae bacterium]
MTKELSAFMDSELEVHEEPALWATLKANSHLRDTWRCYKLIGDAMRDEGDLARDITARVMSELTDEPTVLAPPSRRPARWSSVLMALAASVAGIAVVGWLAVLQFGSPEQTTLARVEQPKSAKVAKAAATPAAGMQEYMLAHQVNAPGLDLQGGAQHIRTVSVVGGGQ